MAITAESGPFISFGQAPNSDNNYEMASSLFWGGTAVLDPRPYYTYEPGQGVGNLTAGWLASSRITTIDAVPVAKSATIVAAAANIVSGTAMTLASTTADGVLVGTSIVRADLGTVVNGLLKLDPSVASVTANLQIGSNVLTVTAVGAGGTHGYNKLSIGQTVTDTTTAANIPTGTAIVGYGTGGGLTGTYILSAAATATATGDTVTAIDKGFPNTIPFGSAGTIQLFNPYDLLSRGLIITASNALAATTTFTVNGYDIYGYPMTENILVTPGTALTTSGVKAFKYIASVTPNATDATYTFSVGTTEVVGLPLRSDFFAVPGDADLSISFNTAQITATTGYVQAVLTTPTATTGDVRGTYTLQTASNGTLRLIVVQSPLVANLNNGAVGLYGVPHYANF